MYSTMHRFNYIFLILKHYRLLFEALGMHPRLVQWNFFYLAPTGAEYSEYRKVYFKITLVVPKIHKYTQNIIMEGAGYHNAE